MRLRALRLGPCPCRRPRRVFRRAGPWNPSNRFNAPRPTLASSFMPAAARFSTAPPAGDASGTMAAQTGSADSRWRCRRRFRIECGIAVAVLFRAKLSHYCFANAVRAALFNAIGMGLGILVIQLA
ncbi:protein of unknown function [Paraburkholderia kururiensis]